LNFTNSFSGYIPLTLGVLRQYSTQYSDKNVRQSLLADEEFHVKIKQSKFERVSKIPSAERIQESYVIAIACSGKLGRRIPFVYDESRLESIPGRLKSLHVD
jgi:hypothetical protein